MVNMSIGRTVPIVDTALTAATGSPYRKLFRVCVLGSGNWGTAIAKIVAENCAERRNFFQPEVRMWVHEEIIGSKKLSEIVNEQHENVKYLPGVRLPSNIVADPDIRRVADGADIVVINIPHQFLRSICAQLKGIDFRRAIGVSCLKGINVTKDGVDLLTDYIYKELSLHCGVLSGANIASEVARERWCETTIAFPRAANYVAGDADANLVNALFHRPYFHVQMSNDTAGVSIGGALKNVIALGVGLVQGVGWGDNAMAAVMRRGLIEMIKFSMTYFPSAKPETFTYESAGIADLITSCAGGRNVKVGKAFAQSNESIFEIEKKLLNGQSAQGVVTVREVHELLTNTGQLEEFPLMVAIYDAIFNGLKVEDIPDRLYKD